MQTIHRFLYFASILLLSLLSCDRLENSENEYQFTYDTKGLFISLTPRRLTICQSLSLDNPQRAFYGDARMITFIGISDVSGGTFECLQYRYIGSYDSTVFPENSVIEIEITAVSKDQVSVTVLSTPSAISIPKSFILRRDNSSIDRNADFILDIDWPFE